jgi:tudor domain-containing protein 2
MFVSFSVETDHHRVCVIRGTPEGAQLAESLIHDIIFNQPLIETYEMFIPQVCIETNA